MADADFSKEVHAVVVQINEWMTKESPNPERLIPAMAVALGRLIGHRADSASELKRMLEITTFATEAAATEHFEEHHPRELQ